jgi:hypothetical protein
VLGDYQTLPLSSEGRVVFSASPGRVEGFDSGYFEIAGTLRFQSGERTIELENLRIHPAASGEMDWVVADAKGNAWFNVNHGMYRLTRADRLEFPTMDLRAGPAFAAWAGHPEATGFLVGEMRMESTVLAGDEGLPQPKSCDNPKWPNVGGFQADVKMEHITAFQMRCRKISNGAQFCDGPAADNGEVVFAPDSTLRNSALANSADVPWYTKFTSPQPPYNNDQHPFLIWNLYRVDANGKLEQIGRSGVKHAFVSVNVGCAPGSNCSFGNILGQGCGDTYATGNNDSAFDLGPRREIIPATGQWGRCGSIFDDTDNNAGDGLAGCDGQEDGQSNGNFGSRMIVRESQIDPALNPGAKYYWTSWYIVRDDINIYNTMGFLDVIPAWNSSFSEWVMPNRSGTSFQVGAAIDQWVTPGTVAADRRNNELSVAEGHARVAVRTVDVGGGQFRYDYAVENFDFARGVTQNAEPNLRVVRNLGFDAFSLPIPAGVTVSALEFADGDLDPANDWTATVAGNTVTWTCPLSAAPSPPTRCVIGTELNWGTLYRFGYTANAAPQTVSSTLTVAEAGTPAVYQVSSLAPMGAAVVDLVFASGFEDGE